MLSRNSQRVFSNERLDPRLRAGLVGHWIGGGSGNTWVDRSGYGRHGTLTNGPLWTLGEGGKRNAVEFDGSNDYVDFNNTSNPLLSATGDWTIAVWANTSTIATGEAELFGQYIAAASNGRLLLRRSGSKWVLFLGNTATLGTVSVTGTTTIVVGQWYHVIARRIGNTFTLYVNGNQDATNTDGSTRSIWQGGSMLGLRTNVATAYNDLPHVDKFKGRLDDVRVYNRALSEAEISLLASPSFSPVTRRRTFLGKRSGAAPPPTTSGNFFLMFR